MRQESLEPGVPVSVPRFLCNWRFIRQDEDLVENETRLRHNPLNVITLAADFLDVILDRPVY